MPDDASPRTVADGPWAGLARVALAMAAATSVEAVHRALVDGALPVLAADGCGLVVPAADGGWQLAFSSSFDPRLRARYDHEPFDSPLPACRAAREGTRFLVPDREAAAAVHPRMEEVVDLTGRRRWALLPLVAGEDVLGSLAVCWTDPAPFGTVELDLLEALAAHTAPTLQRVLAGESERRASRALIRVAHEIQQDVLTQLPRSTAVQLAVRYVPADLDADLGGDWYDAFRTRAGDLLLTVGDIAGHDLSAAAAMTRVRSLLRGLAWGSAEGPARLLDHLDAVVSALEPGTLATAVLVRVRSAADGSTTLTWASAGHPPPVVRGADGRVEVLTDGDDLLLGVDSTVRRREHEHPLPPGAVLALYTDGLVEDRGEDLTLGLQRLGAALGDVDPTDLQRACDLLVDGRDVPHRPGPAARHHGGDDRTLLLLRCRDGDAADAADDADAGSRAVTTRPAPTGGPDPVAVRLLLLPPEPVSAGRARAVVDLLCQEQRWEEDTADTALLLTSELVGNAVVHGRSEVRLRVTSTTAILLVEVEDDNERLPELLPDDDDALSGRGLRLVEDLSDAWGVRPRPGPVTSGKVVWFSLGRAR